MARMKKKHKFSYREPELNIMPFIDVFGLLTTYLLFSAVFVSIGILDVQVPFLSNAAPPPSENQRTLGVKVAVDKEIIELNTTWSEPPADPQKWEYKPDAAGIAAMHKQLYAIRKENLSVDLVTLFSEDDVKYETLTDIIDAIKLRWEGDPPLPITQTDPLKPIDTDGLFSKVVMGSVLL